MSRGVGKRDLDERQGRKWGVADCMIEGCLRPHRAKGLCVVHYRRVRRGKPLLTPNLQRGSWRVGDQVGELTLVANAGTRWTCLCTCGLVIEREASNLATCDGTCGDREAHPKQPRGGPNPTYSTAHYRVRSARGDARRYQCVDCQQAATQWSYDNQDSDELVTPGGVRYSRDVERYQPRCTPCHSKYDSQAG